jgi:hypothetical protein
MSDRKATKLKGKAAQKFLNSALKNQKLIENKRKNKKTQSNA